MSESLRACLQWLTLTGALFTVTLALIWAVDLCCRRGR